jgi:DNA-directed RNA polymerase subunit M/transcription elongation factor TFIIS|tara:strand:+ start:3583 stop:3948 length:366 start_codon:yes stop_codon:yes gene_type:complete
MEINFCDKCDNHLFLYSDEETQRLYLGCKACGNKKEYNDTNCIYNNEYDIDLSKTINNNQYLENDITLPTIQNNPNIRCTNKECISIKEGKPSNVLYIKYEHDSMKYIYICKYCKQSWTNK